MESAGDHLTGQALNYYKKTRDRDIAILTLLLGTGIRVSECVGLDLKDVDFEEQWNYGYQKRWQSDGCVFGDEVAGALENYITGDREASTPRLRP